MKCSRSSANSTGPCVPERPDRMIPSLNAMRNNRLLRRSATRRTSPEARRKVDGSTSGLAVAKLSTPTIAESGERMGAEVQDSAAKSRKKCWVP